MTNGGTILQKYRTLLWWGGGTLLLFLSFQYNAFNLIPQNWFLTNQKDMESHVVGRIVQARQDGLFSKGGLTGLGGPTETPAEFTLESFIFQYQSFLSGERFHSFTPYKSQIGGQAWLFAILDRLLPLEPRQKLILFFQLTALLTAATLAVIIAWFDREFGPVTALSVFLSLFLSQWLTAFGRNLWWSLWAFYIPPAVLLWTGERLVKKASPLGLGLLTAGLMATKCFFTGYEFITTTAVMAALPWLYFAVREKLPMRTVAGQATAVGIGIGAAVGLTMVVVCFQIGSVEGGFGAGVQHLTQAFLKRSHADPASLPPEYAESLRAGHWPVLKDYLNGSFLDLEFRSLPVRIPYFVFPILLAAATGILFFRKALVTDPRARALALTTWVALLAPLSWLIGFKAHAFIHTHLDFLVWQMPFTFFVMALLTVAVIPKQIECPESEIVNPES